MKLKNAEVGKSYVITGYDKSLKAYRQKLLSMGLIKNTTITLKRVAPLGDPVEIVINGYKLSLRKQEADALEVELKG